MRLRILSFTGVMCGLLALAAFYGGCTRELAKPLNPTGAPPTHTRTPTLTPTSTQTQTPTITNTPLVPPTATPTFTSTGTPTPTNTPDPGAIIDTMEDNDGQVLLQGGRSGYWYTYVGTGTVWPPSPFAVSAPGNGMGTALYCARSTGNSTNHVGMGFNLVEPKALYDATGGGSYTGIRFYARVETGSTIAVRFKMPDVNTDPDGGNCGSQPGGCYNDFGRPMTFTTAWVQYQVPYSTLTQESGWGWAPPGGFTPTQVYAVQWQLNNTAGFDLQVDDVTFY